MKNSPLCVTIQERTLLTKEGAGRETFHIVLNFPHLPFKVGDSIAIHPHNDPLLVNHLIEALGITEDETVCDPKTRAQLPVRAFLTYKANLSRLTTAFLTLFYTYEASHDKKNQLRHLLEHKVSLSQYLAAHDPLDLFKEYQGRSIPLQELCEQFGPLLPRFYSAASSPTVYPHEVHLTVDLCTFTHQGEVRYGVGSHFLCSLAVPQETPIPIYVQSTPHFTLPPDDTTPIILVGPGTGLAPYRAFLQERKARNASGDNWLFFGNRSRTLDYLYETELEAWRAEGHIRLDLAFSRDQQEKCYVQHKLLEHASEVWRYLEGGAYFYVCGDAHHMGKDVDAALHTLVQQESGLSVEDTRIYVRTLRRTKRYLTDLY